MLDRYWFENNVDGISPEAPVPIAKINKIEDRRVVLPMARNIASLGGNVTLLSVVGEDEPSLVLEKLLLTEQVNTVFKRFNYQHNCKTTCNY